MFTDSSGPAGGLDVWRADRVALPALPAWPTGYPALDAELPGGGWPATGLTELLLAAPGCGELRLLAPALCRQALQRELLWIAPPLTPYAPALAAQGWPLERLVWVAPATEADAAWAAEQALRSGACAAVLWWGQGTPTRLRRLHLAAQAGGCALFVLRPAALRAQSSPAPLRLACEGAPEGRLAVRAVKRRGPPMAAPLLVELPATAALRRSPRGAPAELGDAVVRAAPALVAA